MKPNMNGSKNDWEPYPVRNDSESESAPLLSSESHTSVEPAMFEDSETSDSDSTPTNNSRFKYGSLETCSLHSNVTVIPKRPPPLAGDALVSPLVLNTSSTLLNVTQDRCYEIHNSDLVFNTERYVPNGRRQLFSNDFANKILSEPCCPLRRETKETMCKDAKSRQNSLVTIFSIWNTILGSSLLTIPWGIQMAGFFPGIILTLAMSGLCLYTAYCLLLVHRYHGGQRGVEVVHLCRAYLNKWAEYVAKAFSVTVLFGAIIAYWVLMSNFLYNSVNFIYDNVADTTWQQQQQQQQQYSGNDGGSNSSEILCPKMVVVYNGTNGTAIIHDYATSTLGPAWDLYKTVPLFLGLLIFPFLNFSSPTFFTKFNSLGTMSIVYLIVFVLVKSASWGVNMSESDWEVSWTLRSSFPALSGMLAMSFFIHNIIVTIMQNNRDQSKNGRDLSIAYLLVTSTYITVGVVFYVCFPLSKACIEDNMLNNFQKWSGLTVGARIVLLFQLLTVYPLLAYMLRVQLLASIGKTSSVGRVVAVNLVLISVCVLFAVFVPYIGTIIRYTGALSGFIYVFTLPSLLYLTILKERDSLSILSIVVHTTIPLIGLANLAAQFFITEK